MALRKNAGSPKPIPKNENGENFFSAENFFRDSFVSKKIGFSVPATKKARFDEIPSLA